jgi:hypothetical protein
VFFGDHRPSIPGVTTPAGDRDTPYVIVRFSAGGGTVGRAVQPVDLTPDQLHHAILQCVLAQSAGRSREKVPSHSDRAYAATSGDSWLEAQEVGA